MYMYGRKEVSRMNMARIRRAENRRPKSDEREVWLRAFALPVAVPVAENEKRLSEFQLPVVIDHGDWDPIERIELIASRHEVITVCAGAKFAKDFAAKFWNYAPVTDFLAAMAHTKLTDSIEALVDKIVDVAWKQADAKKLRLNSLWVGIKRDGHFENYPHARHQEGAVRFHRPHRRI